MDDEYIAELSVKGTAKSQIEIDEGFQQFPYRCTSGFLTIGYGRNLQIKGIEEDEASHLLDNDINEVYDELSTKLPLFNNLDITRKSVLINMGFNMGVEALLGFKKTIACMESGDFDGASREMLLSKWASQVGERAIRLSAIIKTGVSPLLQ